MPIAKKSAKAKSRTNLSDYATDTDTFEDENSVDLRSKGSAPSSRGGWDAAEDIQRRVKTSFDFFVFTEDANLISFTEGAPMDSYLVHWVDTAKGRRSFRCLFSDGGCPLCDLGDSPGAKFAFWVVQFDFKGDDVSYESKIMEVGTKVKNTLRDIDSDPRKGGPLLMNFFSAHRTGKLQSTQHHISRIKDRDLEEDWGITPEEGRSAIKELQEKGAPRLYVPSREDMEDAAAYIRRLG